MNIVFLDAYPTAQGLTYERFEKLGRFKVYEETPYEFAAERIAGCEVVIINKVKMDKALIDSNPNLRLICEAATGTNNIDVAYAESKGIRVMNVAGYSTECVVQVTFTHMLNLVFRGGYFDNLVKSGKYTADGYFCNLSRSFDELASLRLGIIGMGAIGQKVASVATAFGMEVAYFSTSGTGHCKDYPSLPLEELLSTCDIITVHAPLNPRTNGLIGKAELEMMKPTAFMLNMGRGGIVDEAALAEAVDNGTIAGAALDVFVQEPLPADHPFMTMKHRERMFFSPHVAWAGNQTRLRLFEMVADNIETFLREQD